jgi:hypothetical protein
MFTGVKHRCVEKTPGPRMRTWHPGAGWVHQAKVLMLLPRLPLLLAGGWGSA